MSHRASFALAVLLAPFVLACRPSGPALATDTDDATTDGQTGNMTTGGPNSTGGSNTTGTSATGSTTESPEDCAGDPDLVGECDIWCQDCPEQEKCILLGEGSTFADWYQTRCQPIRREAQAEGDPCEDNAALNQGADDCQHGSICLSGPYHQEPHCMALCTGTPADPNCTEPDRCIVHGHLPLCALLCDPLEPIASNFCYGNAPCHAIDQICPDCFPMTTTGTFTCGLDSQFGSIGDLCSGQSFCKGNLFCAPPARFPGCDDRCCVPFCDLNAPDCPPETTCFAAFEPGAAPAGVEHVGVCLTP